MKWGRGYKAATERAATITRQELVEQGVTREMVIAWREGYMQAVKNNPRNGSAAGRVILMDRAAELLR